MRPSLLMHCIVLVSLASAAAAESPKPGERSFWLHASLAPLAQRGYWGRDFPICPTPTDEEIRNAARLLSDDYAANRLYLVYHREIPLADVRRVFASWKRHCPKGVEVVPSLLLRMYDKEQSPVFTLDEIRDLAEFFQTSINARQLAIFDVYANRDQGDALKELARRYPEGLIRLGAQPGEQIKAPFHRAVQDTWSGFCHGKTHADWQDKGVGAQTLRAWVEERNVTRIPMAWNLIVVAWDYSATPRGGYPGYDDANKNMPLPAGRNQLAIAEIRRIARDECMAGFSSDLLILQANSCAAPHDGPRNSFYHTLKRGEVYRGYYREAFQDVTTIFRDMRDGLRADR